VARAGGVAGDRLRVRDDQNASALRAYLVTGSMEEGSIVVRHSGRAYAGADDLRRMQATVAAAFATTGLRVGDLAWLSRQQTHRHLSLDIRLWEDGDGQVVGWTFFRVNGGFNTFVAPGYGDPAFVDELLDVIDEAARTAVAAGDALTGLYYTYGVDLARSEEDRALATALQRRGFAPVPSTGGVLRRDLDRLPPPAVPAGYRLRAVETPAHVLGRVEAHRAAFAPSDVTQKMYERVRRTWPYRPELDRIATTEDDEVVAFCTAWIDEENAAGLLEPVGTHPAHRRRGLAKAVCLDALRALRDAGARIAEVGFENTAAFATYQSIGFARIAEDLVFRRDVVPLP
jgi:ribosomal protein S18 acetylase RimI-like enzyme